MNSFPVSRVVAASLPHFVFVDHFEYFCATSFIVAALLDNRGVDLRSMRWLGDLLICESRDSRGWYGMCIYIEPSSITATMSI